MIATAIRFQNGMVAVFDERGEQMPEYQGRYEEVREHVVLDAPPGATFEHADWGRGWISPVRRALW